MQPLILASLPPKESAIYRDFIHVLREFEKVTPDEMSDSTVFRFLQSVDFNVKEALPAVQKSIAWRRSFDWDSVRNFDYTIIAPLLEATKIGHYSEDFEGRPIRIIQPANIDPGDVIDKIPKDRTYHFQLGNMERLVNIILPHQTRKHNKHIYMQIVIVDIKNLNFSKMMGNSRVMDMARTRSALFQDNYPELTAKTIIINVGTFFYGFFKVVSVFMKKKTLDRMVILKDNYLPELLKHTTLDKLPVSLGGTCPYEIDNFPNSYDAELATSYQQKRLN
jgi:hypothetical protein